MATVVTRTVTRSGLQYTRNITIDADGSQELRVTMPSGQTNKQALLSIDVSALKSIHIQAEGATADALLAALTIKTNSSGSPADTLTMTAGNVLSWNAGCGLPNPFASATDVTQVYCTRGADGGGDVVLVIQVDQDITP